MKPSLELFYLIFEVPRRKFFYYHHFPGKEVKAQDCPVISSTAPKQKI